MTVCFCFFFFFQAEDGIRDWSVTGVQTCALPILKNPLDAGFHVEHEFLESAKLDLSGTGQGDGAGGDWADLFSRSEERRAGKECRSRWGRYQQREEEI